MRGGGGQSTAPTLTTRWWGEGGDTVNSSDTDDPKDGTVNSSDTDLDNIRAAFKHTYILGNDS